MKLTNRSAPSDRRGKLHTKEMEWCVLKHYRTHTMYILDDQQGDAPVADLDLAAHYARCADFAEFFQIYSVYEVRSISFPPDSTQEQFTEFIDEILGNKGSDDHVIFVYFGKAYGEDENYMWQFRGAPDHPINAHDFIHQVNHTDIDVLFILDCFIQTRPTKPWSRDHAMTEIFAMNTGMHNEDGERIRHRGDYAVSIIEYVGKYFNRLQERGPPKKDRAMRSIPEILMKDKEMYDNTIRLWFAHPKPSNTPSEDDPIWRFKCDPVKISRGEKFKFYGLHIQPNPLRVELASVSVTADDEAAGEDGAAPAGQGACSEDGDQEDDEDDEDEDEGVFVQ